MWMRIATPTRKTVPRQKIVPQRPSSLAPYFSCFYSSLCESGMRPLLFRTPRRQKFSVPIRAVAVFVGVLPGASSSLLISGKPGLLLPLTPPLFNLSTFNFQLSTFLLPLALLIVIWNCGVEGGNPSLKVPWPRTSYTCILRIECVPLSRRTTMSQCVYMMCLIHLSNHRYRVFRASLSFSRGYWGREQATCICTM